MKKKFTFLLAALMLLTLINLPGKAVGQTRSDKTETFENQTAGQTYNSTQTYNANNSVCGIGWTMYYGTVSTNDVITGSKSAQMRYYSSATSNYPYIKSTTAIDDLTSIAFKAKVSNTNVKMNVEYSTNGTSWTSVASNVTFAATNTAYNLNYNIPSGGKYIKISVSSSSTAPSSGNYKFIIDDVVFTYGSSASVSAPTFDPASGTSFYPTLELTLSSATVDASIRYTTDGSTTPTSEVGYVYDPEHKPVLDATTTVKAIAYKNGVSSSVSEATYTKITPLANIAALTANNSAGTYYVTFTNAVVTYTNGNYAYIQDVSGAVMMYKSGHGLTAGDVLNGTATVSYKLQNGTPEITELSGVTSVSGVAPNPITVVASDWNYTFNNVLSQYFKITDATITTSNDKYYVSVGSAKAVESIQLYGQGEAYGFSIDDLTSSDVFTIIGFPMLYVKNDNTTKEFQIFIVPQKAEINIDASALELPYNANNNGSIAVSYSNFEPYETTATLYSNQECTTPFSGSWIELGNLSDPYTSIPYSVTENAGNSDRTVYLKVESMNENTSVISKKFTITQIYHQTYSVTYTANEGTGNDLVVSGYEYDAPVTVKPNTGEGNPNFTRTGYTFVNWNTQHDGNGTSYSNPATQSAAAAFNITGNTTLYAQWEGDPHSITTVVTPDNSGSVSYKVGGGVVTNPRTDETVTVVVTPETGYALSSLIVRNNSTSQEVPVNNNTFTMPASDITVTATFEEVFSYNVDFESAMSTYTDWVYSNIIAEQTTIITGHGGSGKYGKTDGTTTAYIQTKTKIASPGTFVCYISKIGTNTNANSKWKVQYSSNGSTWTTVGDEQNAAVGITEGTWTKIERDLSSQSNVFVRIYYDGTTAIRTIDDISLEYTPTPKYNLFVASVDNLTITAESGSVNVAEGETKELESGKTVTLSATPVSGYNFSAWDVYKTDESSTKVEVNDNQFDMPSYAVTVTATCIETRTITYSINGATFSTTHNIGNVISLEDPDSGIPTGYDFVGWTENPANTADGNLITSIILNANKTVYAVFKKSNTITITGDDFGAYEKDEEVEATMQNTTWGRYYVMKNAGIQFHKKDGYFYNKTEFNNLVSLVATRSGSDYVIVKTATSIDDWSSASALSITSSSGYADTYTIPSGHTHVLLTNDGVDATTKYTSFAFVFNVDETRYTQVYTETTTTASGDITITGKTIIPSGSTLNMNGHELHNTIAANLIIEDGGQLILKDGDDDVAATVKKNITAPTSWTQNDKTGWYAISSTVGTISDITSVSNFANQTFDLYKYVESSNVGYGWINYAAHTEDFGGLVNGHGYLYARQNGATVSFTGNVNHTDVTLTGLTAKNSANENLRGIHLIGNPYTHNIYKGVAITATKGTMSSTYYRLDGNNLWVVESDDNPIGPGQGFLVKVTDGTDLTFNNNAGSSKANNDYIRFAVSNSEYEDATFALFMKGEGLRKINHRNTEAPMIYISQNDANYASATMDDDTKSFNLNFEAKTMGQYKLSYKVNGEFNYLHVIDRTTGEDIDMLLEGSYSFIGSPMDNANRFIVRLGYLPNYDDNGKDIFAYQNGDNIVVSGEGELQIFDVMGRKVSTMNIYGIETVNGLVQGVYIFRLEGKTQKIVVR